MIAACKLLPDKHIVNFHISFDQKRPICVGLGLILLLANSEASIFQSMRSVARSQPSPFDLFLHFRHRIAELNRRVCFLDLGKDLASTVDVRTEHSQSGIFIEILNGLSIRNAEGHSNGALDLHSWSALVNGNGERCALEVNRDGLFGIEACLHKS